MARGAIFLMLSLSLGVSSSLGCAVDTTDEGAREGDDGYQAESVDTLREVEILAHDAGVPCSHLAMAAAIAKAESGLDTSAHGTNPPTSGCPKGSIDRGLWQINSCYHSDVSEACAYSGPCNAKAMVSISSKGSSWSPWSTYWNGAYKKYLGAATTAYNSGVPGCTAGSGSSSGTTGGTSSGGSCYSNTLGKSEPAHTCVQSKYDSAWYTCISGKWMLGKGVSGGCDTTHPL